MTWYGKLVLVISAIGAINWGLATFGWNAVSKLIGSWAGLGVENLVYYIVALCGIWALIKVFK
ncbi:DUF378 domain-containing protein [Candidatus Woesearchaeota archaeon CG10_big_fil_rev_8_21_14_0_10_34_12]|nr:MAG: DUF378 domain-containing protein [Candidatus Woesearchaeota archaeon CG10_big_fil_rev_8_21_14_0_10_34_12]